MSRKTIRKEVRKMIDDGLPVVDSNGKAYYGDEAKDYFEHGGGAILIVLVIIIALFILMLLLLPAMEAGLP